LRNVVKCKKYSLPKFAEILYTFVLQFRMQYKSIQNLQTLQG
jgi:hypothetical protein